MKKMKGYQRVPTGVTAEEFVKAWQSSKTARDVVEMLGGRISAAGAKVRACQYRRKGVPLRHFRTVNIDYKALAALAKKEAK